MRRIALALATVLLVACAPSDLSSQVGAGLGLGPPKCATLLVKALTSPKVVVPGVLACHTKQLREAVKALGVKTDADFKKVAAQPPLFKHPHYLGSLPSDPDAGQGYEFVVDVTDASGIVHTGGTRIFVWMDPKNQLVSMVGFL